MDPSPVVPTPQQLKAIASVFYLSTISKPLGMVLPPSSIGQLGTQDLFYFPPPLAPYGLEAPPLRRIPAQPPHQGRSIGARCATPLGMDYPFRIFQLRSMGNRSRLRLPLPAQPLMLEQLANTFWSKAFTSPVGAEHDATLSLYNSFIASLCKLFCQFVSVIQIILLST